MTEEEKDGLKIYNKYCCSGYKCTDGGIGPWCSRGGPLFDLGGLAILAVPSSRFFIPHISAIRTFLNYLEKNRYGIVLVY